jgi:hypothetical protein
MCGPLIKLTFPKKNDKVIEINFTFYYFILYTNSIFDFLFFLDEKIITTTDTLFDYISVSKFSVIINK